MLVGDSIAALPLRQQRILAVGIILSQFKFRNCLKISLHLGGFADQYEFHGDDALLSPFRALTLFD